MFVHLRINTFILDGPLGAYRAKPMMCLSDDHEMVLLIKS